MTQRQIFQRGIQLFGQLLARQPVFGGGGVAVGVAGLFSETHQDPDKAPSDGPNMVPLDQFEALAAQLIAFDDLAIASGVKGPVAKAA